jgi:hypothetical protein
MKVIVDAFGTLVAAAGIKALPILSIPSEDTPQVTTGNLIGFICFGFLFLVCLLGIAVEYTNLFDISTRPDNYEDLEDSNKDKALLKSKGTIGKIFLAFSFSRNTRKIFWAPQKDTDYLSVLNGIRVISMMYIIFGHVHEVLISMPMTNLFSAFNMQHEFYAAIISGGFYSVDVFFFISAFLGAYLMITKFQGMKCLNFGMIYLHRIIRLIPTLLLFI